jgi:hypothetical protein
MKIKDLIVILQESTKTKTILVPSDDYYARPGDSSEYILSYICPHTLMAELLKYEGDKICPNIFP